MPNLSTNYNVLGAKEDLGGVLHGSTINQVQGVDNIFNRTARQFLLDCDPQETIRIAQTPILFDNVYDYPISNLPDLKGNRIIDIRPQVDRGLRDVFGQTYAQQFDVNKSFASAPNFTVDFNTGEKSLRIDATDLLTGILINSADSLAGSGTWVTGGNATNLAVDNVNFVATPASLKFDLSAGGAGSTGYLENSTMTPVDLSEHLNQAYEFLYSYLPTGSDFSKINLRFGSSSSNYWSIDYTLNWQQASFINGWNLVGNPWGTTKVGSPDESAISYVRVTWTYNGTAQTGVHLNQIYSRLGKIFEILYYSKYLFRDATTGAFQETVTDDSNLINLDTETFPVFFNLLAYYTIQQASGGDAQSDMAFFFDQYVRGMAKYQALYKSQAQKPQSTYYKQNKPGYQKYFGNRYP